MTAADQVELTALIEAANGIGARPFKGATGSWANAVEVALLDTLLSIGARTNDQYGAGVLPRLRAYKAFRGPANMMRIIATLGPFGLADFVPEQRQIDQLMTAGAALLDAGITTGDDVDADSAAQREALMNTPGVPEAAWLFFLSNTGSTADAVIRQQQAWLDAFTTRAIGRPEVTVEARDALLDRASEKLNAEHQRKSYGMMPEFTLAQLHHAIYRAEFARATDQA